MSNENLKPGDVVSHKGREMTLVQFRGDRWTSDCWSCEWFDENGKSEWKVIFQESLQLVRSTTPHPEPFKPGDKVQLQSGGPIMVIIGPDKFDDESYECAMDSDGSALPEPFIHPNIQLATSASKTEEDDCEDWVDYYADEDESGIAVPDGECPKYFDCDGCEECVEPGNKKESWLKPGVELFVGRNEDGTLCFIDKASGSGYSPGRLVEEIFNSSFPGIDEDDDGEGGEGDSVTCWTPFIKWLKVGVGENGMVTHADLSNGKVYEDNEALIEDGLSSYFIQKCHLPKDEAEEGGKWHTFTKPLVLGATEDGHLTFTDPDTGKAYDEGELKDSGLVKLEGGEFEVGTSCARLKAGSPLMHVVAVDPDNEDNLICEWEDEGSPIRSRRESFEPIVLTGVDENFEPIDKAEPVMFWNKKEKHSRCFFHVKTSSGGYRIFHDKWFNKVLGELELNERGYVAE